MIQLSSGDQTQTAEPAPQHVPEDMSSGSEGGSAGAEHIFTALRNSTVMMVDDDRTTLDFVQKFLQRAGYTSFIATTDPRDALRLITQKRPDIVLLDLMMPDVSGFEILASMRAR